MTIRLEVDRQRMDGVAEEIIGRALLAGTRTIRDATRRLEKDFEGLFRGAVPGQAWRVWASKVYPRGDKGSYNPVGEVFANGGARSQGLVSYYTQAGTNRAKDGFWLAYPLPAAGSRGRSRAITPGEWERAHGVRLQFVYKGMAGFAMLVAVGVFAKNNSGTFRAPTAGRLKDRHPSSIPIFLLIPYQRHANSVALEPAVMRAHQYVVESYGRRLKRSA